MMFHNNTKLNQNDWEVKNSAMKILPLDYTLGLTDVLCGRGKKCFEHAGNQMFRKLVEHTLDRYIGAQTRMGKSLIIREVISFVRVNAKGRFVKHDPCTGRFYALGNAVAREKTSQAFRDAIYGLFKKRRHHLGVTSGITERISQSFSQPTIAVVNLVDASNDNFCSEGFQWEPPTFFVNHTHISNDMCNPDQPTCKDSDCQSMPVSDLYSHTPRSLITPTFFDLTGSTRSDELVGEYQTNMSEDIIMNDFNTPSEANFVCDGMTLQDENETDTISLATQLPLVDPQPLRNDQLWDHLVALTEVNLSRCDDPFEPIPIPE